MGYIEEIRALVGNRPLILPGAVVMIFDHRGWLLLEHRADEDHWDLPGGYTEAGETMEETARREVYEETGLTIGRITLYNVFSGKEFFFVYPNGDQVHPVMVVYITKDVTGQENMDPKEVTDLVYFPPDDLPTGLYPEIRGIIEGYLQQQGYQNTE